MKRRYGLSSLVVTAVISTACVSCYSAQPIGRVTIYATDYTFSAPPSVRPGLTAFSFENHGDVKHELILVQLKEGATLQQFLDSAQVGGNGDSVVDRTLGVLLANPGHGSDGELLVHLVPFRVYAMVCALRDAPDRPSHLALGMATSFETD